MMEAKLARALWETLAVTDQPTAKVGRPSFQYPRWEGGGQVMGFSEGCPGFWRSAGVRVWVAWFGRIRR